MTDGADGRPLQLRVHGVSGTDPSTALALDAKRIDADRTSGVKLYAAPAPFLDDSVEVRAFNWGDVTSGRRLHAFRFLLTPFMLANATWWMAERRSVRHDRLVRSLLLLVALGVTAFYTFILTKPLLVNLVGGCYLVDEPRDRLVCRIPTQMGLGLRGHTLLGLALTILVLAICVRALHSPSTKAIARALIPWPFRAVCLDIRPNANTSIDSDEFWAPDDDRLLVQAHLSLAFTIVLIEVASIVGSDMAYGYFLKVSLSWILVILACTAWVGASQSNDRVSGPGAISRRVESFFLGAVSWSWWLLSLALILTAVESSPPLLTVESFLEERQFPFINGTTGLMLLVLLALLVFTRNTRLVTASTLSLLAAGTIAASVNSVSAQSYGLDNNLWTSNFFLALAVAFSILVCITTTLALVVIRANPMTDVRPTVLSGLTSAFSALVRIIPSVFLLGLIGALANLVLGTQIVAPPLYDGISLTVIGLIVPVTAMSVLPIWGFRHWVLRRTFDQVSWVALTGLFALAATGLALLVLAVADTERMLPIVESAVATTILIVPATQIGRTLLSALRDQEFRRLTGIPTDIGAFWPRYIHPFSARPYGGNVVQGLLDELHRNQHRVVIIAGHSQGSIIAAVALSRLSHRPSNVAFLSYGSPLASIYMEVFPRAFDDAFVGQVQTNVNHRWRNLRRCDDPIASKPITIAVGSPVEIQVSNGHGHSSYEATKAYADATQQLILLSQGGIWTGSPDFASDGQ